MPRAMTSSPLDGQRRGGRTEPSRTLKLRRGARRPVYDARANRDGEVHLALISNPVSEVTAPLARVEAALTQLCADLGTLEVLPGVENAVGKTNDRLERVEQEVALTRAASEQMAETLEAIRVELAEAVRLMAAGVVAGAASSGDKTPAVATVPRAARARKRA